MIYSDGPRHPVKVLRVPSAADVSYLGLDGGAYTASQHPSRLVLLCTDLVTGEPRLCDVAGMSADDIMELSIAASLAVAGHPQPAPGMELVDPASPEARAARATA